MYEEPASSDDISLCYGKPDEKNFEPDSTCTYFITYADVLIGKCYVMMFKELTTKKAKGFIFQYIIARMMFDLIKEGDQWISIDGHEAVTVKDQDVLMKVAANVYVDIHFVNDIIQHSLSSTWDAIFIFIVLIDLY